jgi:hypothetical protein
VIETPPRAAVPHEHGGGWRLRKEEVSDAFIDGAAPFLDTLSVAPLSLKGIVSDRKKQLPAIVPAFPDKTKS